jgi:pyruvate formate lyase activating enzyme
MTYLPATSVGSLEKACEIGEKAGLKFIYTGNVPGHQNENTVCYSCGKIIVERVGYQTDNKNLAASKCRFCGAGLNFRMTGRNGVEK